MQQLTIIMSSLFLVSGCFPSETPQSKISTYEDARAIFWHGLYKDGGETLYCAVPFKRRNANMNIEHIFPMGWVVKELKCRDRKDCRRTSKHFNQIESDLHNLYPSLIHINKVRGNFPFAHIKGEHWLNPNCDFEIHFKKRAIEPRDEVRGDIARAMLYMHSQYSLNLFKRQKKMLIRWHFADLPTEIEKKRNDKIEQIQGNRNPLIDDANLASRL